MEAEGQPLPLAGFMHREVSPLSLAQAETSLFCLWSCFSCTTSVLSWSGTQKECAQDWP